MTMISPPCCSIQRGLFHERQKMALMVRKACPTVQASMVWETKERQEGRKVCWELRKLLVSRVLEQISPDGSFSERDEEGQPAASFLKWLQGSALLQTRGKELMIFSLRDGVGKWNHLAWSPTSHTKFLFDMHSFLAKSDRRLIFRETVVSRAV